MMDLSIDNFSWMVEYERLSLRMIGSMIIGD